MQLEPTSDLRVALVLPYPSVSEWMRRLLHRMTSIDCLCVSIIGIEDVGSSSTSRKDTFAMWQQFDAKIFGADQNPLRKRSFEELLGATTPGQPESRHVFRENGEFVEHIKEQRFDVVLWMLPTQPPIQILEQGRLGVWSPSNILSDTAGFWELVKSVPVTACELRRIGLVPTQDVVLGSAYAKTDQKSLAKTLRVVHALGESLIIAALNKANRTGEGLLQSCPTKERLPDQRPRPGFISLMYWLTRLYARYIGNIVTYRLYMDQWQLAYRVGGERLSQKDLLRLAPPHSGFWADPFVIQRDGRTVIVFEELPESKPSGRIATIEIDSDGTAGSPRIVLERDYHLSYPFLLEFDDTLFMIPESAEAKKVEAFRCVSFPDQWEPHAVLLDGVRAYDPTLIEYEGRWWMFVTVAHNGNTTDDELHLYYASEPFGQWVSHPANPICLDVRCARPAGALFWEDGQLLRPAQDCSERYGFALAIQRVIRMDTTGYEEEPYRRILPDWADDALATHTVNQAAGVTVYDCIARRRK